MESAILGRSIHINGVVQGVGFRPAVWKLARENQLVGSVRNGGAGVLIEAWGTESRIDHFLQQLQADPPPLATIKQIHTTPLTTNPPEQFTIAGSAAGRAATGVAADAASCPYCIDEVMEPDNRRYRYPFTNCTHCGPRLSIIRSIPYDRENSSMAPFTMCAACQEEYDDPEDRRFHAQPNCCPECGPQLWLEERSGETPPSREGGLDPIEQTATLLRKGKIVAIKGVGGVHLACDATNEEVVAELRRRKQRGRKPFAVMARNCEMAQRYCTLSPTERELLVSSTAPIVVLQQGGEPLAPSVSPIQQGIGLMLPYTPLHHLLMEGVEFPIVLTSGNRASEPQCISNEEARRELAGIADYWLLHDREIVSRVDDSVIQVVDGTPRTLRLGRGMAPAPVTLPGGFEASPPLLAMGGALKNSFSLLQHGRVTCSQYMGDLENSRTLREYQRTMHLYQELFGHHSQTVVVDRHPDYLSSQLGREWAQQQGLSLLEVQHHHAHIASCMVEHGVPLDAPPLLGIAMDGLGYGERGEIWGGEFLVADYRGFQRVGNLAPTALPGGNRAAREPWRNSYAHLAAASGWKQITQAHPDLEIVHYLETKPLGTLGKMVRQGVNSPLSSSCGRLIDAVAAALGFCRESITFEGEATIELESAATPHFAEQERDGYPFQLQQDNGQTEIGWRPMWEGILHDLEQGAVAGVIAARFHQGLIDAITETTTVLCQIHDIDRVALGGGVFQNRLLLEGITKKLERKGLAVLSPQQIPANDQGIAIGQCAIAAAILLQQNRP